MLAQTYQNIQVIVAAHGCTDGTIWRANRFQDRRVIALDVPRRPSYPPTAENHWFAGPVQPLNAALRVARGSWFARIDDDDVWAEDHLERLLRFAQKGNYEFVSSAHDTPAGKVEPYRFLRHEGRYVQVVNVGGTQTWLWRSYLRFMRWNPDCWRRKFNRVNDTDLQDRMFKAGVRMGYLDEITAHVYPRPGEIEIGLKAYTADEKRTLERYAFDEK